jgi:putative transposase
VTREFKKLSHSIYECKYHIVFCPQYRYRVLREEGADYVKREIYKLCEHKDGVEVIEANVQADHVHLVLSIPPKYAVSNLMGYLNRANASNLSK